MSNLTTYKLTYGSELVSVVKGKSGMTEREVREQARLNSRLELEKAPGLLSKIHYAHVEVLQ